MDQKCEYETSKSFLELILEMTNEGVKFSEQDCIDEVTTFLVGVSYFKAHVLSLRTYLYVQGSDTTSTTLGFTLLALGMFSEIQDKIVAELDQVIGSSTRPICPEDLVQLKYMERVIKETMRLFPVSTVIARECTEDTNLGLFNICCM